MFYHYFQDLTPIQLALLSIAIMASIKMFLVFLFVTKSEKALEARRSSANFDADETCTEGGTTF